MREENLKDKISDDVKSYVCMRIDSVKLSLVDNLSEFVGKGIAFLVCLLCVNIGMLLLACALVYALLLLINSLLWAIVIVAVVFLVMGILLFMKNRIFVNRMVKVFSHMLFSVNQKHGSNE